ncbi:histidine phosphatase family protein [Propioniciclava sp. MC1595]|jgi:phosphohistidine phosphatase|uniref:SixA phosphatase family protein n=1 Tax=unclassified Propioniciclava TaxID=2642922 RepID=UPI001601E549|nr:MULTISPECIES: phosphoglycerate mutase family protein [unclassified Propioniciclava]MBB1494414.1 histidine phosphatase family protein [Propioniciclava sp. MC1595]MBB1500537.1 histidine phosphatase family protein [Propioniciclava sp. MC1683]NLE17474.1 histidine phosphatase family protein [Propioniciclava sp.]QTE27215.1 histidine phosphatase family protein [Propioniciclava sp. MC1595]
MKRVYLIRHGEAEFMGRGVRGDHGRELTPEGHEQARHLGELLADAGIQVVLASTADRAAQTAHGMGLDAEVRLVEDLYHAGTVGLLRELGTLDEGVAAAAVVAHAPGVPALVDALAGPDPDPRAAAAALHHYPTAMAAGIEFSGAWSELEVVPSRLFWAERG